ncbi:hypothetical protein LJR045_002708 [Microbacterium sp. LjRoot45]
MTSTRRRMSCLLSVLSLASLGIAGCAGDPAPEPSETPRFELSVEQAAALEDGTVTRDEYDAAFRRYESCITEAGFALVEVREEYQVIRYSVPNEAVVSGVDDDCYNGEFVLVDSQWQVSVEDVGEVASLLAGCLIEAGLDSSGTKAEKEQRLESAGISIDACLDSQR